MQAANSTTGIKHVYTTLTALWKYFHYSPKRAESLKEIQHVLNLSEMKVIKPSDTRWLAHELCVKTEASYTAVVVTLTVIPESPCIWSFGIIQGSIQVHHHCSHLSTGLHLTISSQAQ